MKPPNIGLKTEVQGVISEMHWWQEWLVGNCGVIVGFYIERGTHLSHIVVHVNAGCLRAQGNLSKVSTDTCSLLQC